MIELKLTFATFEEAADAMLRLAGSDVAISATVAETVNAPAAAEPSKKGRKPKADAETVKDTPSEPDTQQNISSGAEDRTDPEASEDKPAAFASDDEKDAFFKEQVRPAMSRYMAKHGQDAARKHLNDFEGLGTAKLSDLPAERYRAFVEACDAA